MFTTKQKLQLCKIDYYLNDYPELFDVDKYKEVVIKPYIDKIPSLSEYVQVSFDYGKHLYCEKQDKIKDYEDKSFLYCYNLLEEYKLLLEGATPNITIPGSKNCNKRKKKQEHITYENYRKILMLGFEEEMRRNRLNCIAKTAEEIDEDIKNGINIDWIEKQIALIYKTYPNYPPYKRNEMLTEAYALKFPDKFFEFTPEHIDFMLQRGKDINKNDNYKKKKGRPSANFVRECIEHLYLLLIIDSLAIEIVGFEDIRKKKCFNSNIRYEFIYDFLHFFNIYETSIDDNFTSNKSSLIKSLLKTKKGITENGFCYNTAYKAILIAIIVMKDEISQTIKAINRPKKVHFNSV
jgi:hypothetical protein